MVNCTKERRHTLVWSCDCACHKKIFMDYGLLPFFSLYTHTHITDYFFMNIFIHKTLFVLFLAILYCRYLVPITCSLAYSLERFHIRDIHSLIKLCWITTKLSNKLWLFIISLKINKLLDNFQHHSSHL